MLDKTRSNVYTVYIRYKQYTRSEKMNIIISNAVDRSIYQQIYDSIKADIISSRLAEGDALPSIRNLAKDLRISVITTKRAYDELERDGYINSVPGKGFFVAQKNTELIKEAHLREIEQHMNEILRLASSCGIGTDDIIEMFKAL